MRHNCNFFPIFCSWCVRHREEKHSNGGSVFNLLGTINLILWDTYQQSLGKWLWHVATRSPLFPSGHQDSESTQLKLSAASWSQNPLPLSVRGKGWGGERSPGSSPIATHPSDNHIPSANTVLHNPLNGWWKMLEFQPKEWLGLYCGVSATSQPGWHWGCHAWALFSSPVK
jgi:hypothetical protein